MTDRQNAPFDNDQSRPDYVSAPRRVAWIVAAWLGSHAILIAGHVLLIFLYSLLVAPGLENEAYQEFALRSGPWFSIIAGGPVFYLVARHLLRRFGPSGRMMALVVWALYSATDLAIVLIAGTTFSPWFSAQWIASQSIKLIAVLLAVRAFRRTDSKNAAAAIIG